MAWRRGTENNQAGVIRKGQIKEYLNLSSKQKSSSVSLRILRIEDEDASSAHIVSSLLGNSVFAYMGPILCPEVISGPLCGDSSIDNCGGSESVEISGVGGVGGESSGNHVDESDGELILDESSSLIISTKDDTSIINSLVADFLRSSNKSRVDIEKICEMNRSFFHFLKANGADAILYLHAHDHARSIIPCLVHPHVPTGCIVLSEVQRNNSKVCSGEIEEFTLYLGEETFKYDVREAAIGNTALRQTGRPFRFARRLLFDIKPRSVELRVNSGGREGGTSLKADAKRICSVIEKMLFQSIVTVNDVFSVIVDSVEFTCRLTELFDDDLEEDNEGGDLEDYKLDDFYRGFVNEDSQVYIVVDASVGNDSFLLTDNVIVPRGRELRSEDLLYILTSDNEVFPVKKKLMRPCISLTRDVQAGKGIYKDKGGDPAKTTLTATATTLANTSPANSTTTTTTRGTDSESMRNERFDDFVEDHKVPQSYTNATIEQIEDIIDPEFVDCNLIKFPIDACTFDRVLLYLEHEARHELFQFDPLIASDLLHAAEIMGIQGLIDVCQKVLGSFQERVRKTFIPLDEIFHRNAAGGLYKGKRQETLLIMSGMVFDITRWLDEHPGGSSIIPEQALNVDSTIFFEIYHVSKQSFLYLKEFYIGEISDEDRTRVPLPSNCPAGTTASDAFLEQIGRISSSWRLKHADMVDMASQTFKSF